jgi:hypothetical protein
MGKSCGACNFCCKVLEIAELAKPAGVWCPHAKPGHGCAIHGSHPASCQAFACQWLRDPEMPDTFRPDRCKVVLRMDAEARRITADCEAANPLAWRREPMYGLLKENARRGWAAGYLVFAKVGQKMWLIAPQEDIDLGEVPAGAPLAVEPGADGRLNVRVGARPMT